MSMPRGYCIHGLSWGGPRCEECDIAVYGKAPEGIVYTVPPAEEIKACICKQCRPEPCRGHKYNCIEKREALPSDSANGGGKDA